MKFDRLVPYNDSEIFGFEKNFDYHTKAQWFEKNWTHSVYFSVIYVLLVFGGKRYMSERPKFDLRIPLTVWSASLAVFSIFGAFRLWQEFLFFVDRYGWQESICDPAFCNGVTGFWVWVFAISKLFELGDTLFIVLRRSKLIFLHWYHHITVLMYTWCSYHDLIGAGRYFVTINYTVHAFMYTYYAIKASKLPLTIPSWVNILITLMQLSQMVVGCIVNILAYHYKQLGFPCSTNFENLVLSFAMYFSYFLLFAHFFYSNYIKGKRLPKEVSNKKSNKIE